MLTGDADEYTRPSGACWDPAISASLATLRGSVGAERSIFDSTEVCTETAEEYDGTLGPGRFSGKYTLPLPEPETCTGTVGGAREYACPLDACC